MIDTPKGMSIMQAYELYRGDKLLVNRRYQRKLVWSVYEKQKLIDSILKKYPIPLILLAEVEDGQYEIIDGMQRLNSFFGFIENEFPIPHDGKELYFNTDDYTYAKTQVSKEIFTPVYGDGIEYLSQENASSFISYPFPVTIFKNSKQDEINETFRRINSNGIHLSDQEVRQAGNLSQFADLVREIASEIRGDASKDVLLLSQMPEISIDTKSTHGYGVKAEETFWCMQGILNVSDIRKSEDEQFIADIILSIALGEPFPASKREFNNYYGAGETDKSNEIELKINQLGKKNIRDDINLVFSNLMNFCKTILTDEKLKTIVNPDAGGNPIKEDFYTIFMAFYKLIIMESSLPFDYDGIKKKLTGIHKRLTRSRNYTTTKDRESNIGTCYGLIKDYFKVEKDTFRSATSFIVDFQTYLTRSKVESYKYDFKQGLYTLSPNGREFSEEAFENKIIKNIAAMANLGKGRQGFLFIGVTDKEADTAKIETMDNIPNIPRYNGFGVCGLERESKLRGVTLDEYITFITNKISESDLPNNLKATVVKSITPISYAGFTVLMIQIDNGSEPIYYKDKMYTRDGSNTIEITGSNQAHIFKLFS